MAINTQTIRVDLNTGKTIPVAYAHQNDTNRQLTFQLYNNGVAFTPSSTTVKFAYKSPIVNGQYSVITGSQMASGTVSGNTVTVTLPAAYTQVSGVGLLTMILTTSGNTLRPVNIKFVVQSSADGDDVVLGASDWPAGLYDYMDDWLAENEPTEIANLKSDLLELQSGGYVADAQRIGDVIDDWLDDHPEATTTVQDGSLTYKKLVNGTLGFVTPEMFGAKGDGETDDTEALRQAFNSGKPCFLTGEYLYTLILPCTSDLFGCGTIKHGADSIYLRIDSSVQITGIGFDGNNHSGSLIRIYNADSVWITDCILSKLGVESAEDTTPEGVCGGILINNSSNVFVEHCLIKDINSTTAYGSYGIHVTGTAENIEILHNCIEGIGFYDKTATPSGDADGILVNTQPGSRITISGNTLINCQKRALKLKGENVQSSHNTFIYTSDVSGLGISVIDFQRGNNESINDKLIIQISDSEKQFSINNIISVCASNCTINGFSCSIEKPDEYQISFDTNSAFLIANLLSEDGADSSIDNLNIENVEAEGIGKYFLFVPTATSSAIVSMNNVAVKNTVFSNADNVTVSAIFGTPSSSLWGKINSIHIDGFTYTGNSADVTFFANTQYSNIADSTALNIRNLGSIRPFWYYVASDKFIINYETQFNNANNISFFQNGKTVRIKTDKTNIQNESAIYANLPYRNTPVGTVIEVYPYTVDTTNGKIKIGFVCTTAGATDKTGTFVPCFLSI